MKRSAPLQHDREQADAISKARIVREGQERATEIVARALAEAERSELGAFWALDREGATRTAARVDERLACGKDPGSLGGVTVAVKDLFDVAGLPTTGGVRSDPALARGDAAIVRRLRRAGAIPLGKDVKCAEKVVEVGEHVAPPPVVDVVVNTPTFDGLFFAPTQPIAAPGD